MGTPPSIPSASKGWDAGVTQRAKDGSVEASATWFHRRSSDLITFVSCTAPPRTGICADRPNGTYDNVSRAVAQGLELLFKVRPVGGADGERQLHLSGRGKPRGRHRQYGKQLARRPSQSMTVNVDYRWPIGLETRATLTSIGNSYDNASNARKLQGYTLVDLRASMPVAKGIALYGRIENLFDQHYETIYQYGQPGRAVYGGVRLTL